MELKVLGNPKKLKSPIIQQGDAILKKCGTKGVFQKEYAKIPKFATEKPGNLVLKGQTNSHALYGGEFQFFEHEGVTFLDVKEATVLDHVKDHLGARESAEHHAQWVPKGQYFVDDLLEYDHIKEESRRVID